MKILNLVYPEKSDVEFKHQNFPDGQQNIVISPNVIDSDGIDSWIKPIKKAGTVVIYSRLNNFRHLELIICAVASLREHGVKHIELYTPYIVGARSDRKFEEGGNNYLKTVICPIINSLNLDAVICLDPHSDVLEACLNNFKKESNLNLIKFALNNLCEIYHDDTLNLDDIILISPDAGASKKIYKLAEQIGYKGDIITCSKDRGVDGNINNTIVPLNMSNYNGEDFIIIDDICDGGATFINIARKLKDYSSIVNANRGIKMGKIYLIVTHGIFSKGFDELTKYFDGIYCTNSYSDVAELTTSQTSNKVIPTKVKQLNIF